MTLNSSVMQVQPIAIVPLLSKQQTEKARWLGVLLCKLLTTHLEAAGLPTLPYDDINRHLSTAGQKLPLDQAGVQAAQTALKLRALIHGHYVLDEETKMFGVRLLVEGADISGPPLEASTPLAGFSRFIERLSLALVERLEPPITGEVRQQIRAVPRPANFEAFRQLSEAYAAWSKDLNELALASLESALTLDPDLEEAASVAAAVARTARDTDTAQARFRQWIDMAQRKNLPLVAGERLMMLGHWLFARGEWEKARKVYQEAGTIYRREDHTHGKIQVQNDLANIDLQQGKIQSAIQTYRRSLRAIEDIPDTEQDEAVTLFNLALAHKNLGQTDESMRAVEQAGDLAQRLKDTHLQAKCLMQRGVLHDDKGEWGRASSDYAQALRLFDILNDEKNMAMVKNHQALIYKQQGAYDRAEALLLQALQTFEEESDIHERAIVWFNLAELYYSMQLYEQAWEYAEQAQAVFTRLKSGWLTLAKELIEMLENVPDSPPEETDTYTPPGESPAVD